MTTPARARDFFSRFHGVLFLALGSMLLSACANGPLPLTDSSKYADSERNFAGICSSWAHQGRKPKRVGSRAQYRCQHPWSIPPVAAAAVRTDPGAQDVRATPPVSSARRTPLDLRPLLFQFDSAELDPNATLELEKALAWMREFPNATLIIDGYTDSTGTVAYNQGLSVRRATAAKAFLIERGIPAERLQIVGYGENDPVASNDTQEGRRLNRRSQLRAP